MGISDKQNRGPTVETQLCGEEYHSKFYMIMFRGNPALVRLTLGLTINVEFTVMCG